MTATLPHPSTVGHLHALTGRLPKGAGLVLSGAGRSRNGKFFGRSWDQLVTRETVTEAAQHCRGRQGTVDLYASVTATDEETFAELLAGAEAGRKPRGGEEHARWLYCLWSDLDIAGPGHASTEGLPATVAEAGRIYADLPTPTLVVNSAGGLHVWWLLAEPMEIESDRARAAWLAEGWQQLVNAHARRHGYRSDDVDDLARVLRVCGTENHKLEEPRPVTLHSVGVWPPGLIEGQGWEPGPLHELDDLADLVEKHLATVTPEPVPSPPPRPRPVLDQSWDVKTTGSLNILETVNAASWSDIWPKTWSYVGTETIGGDVVELWKRPDASSAYSAKCWPDGGCQVWSDSIPGLESAKDGKYSKAHVLAWTLGVDLSALAKEIIRAGRALR